MGITTSNPMTTIDAMYTYGTPPQRVRVFPAQAEINARLDAEIVAQDRERSGDSDGVEDGHDEPVG